jgi:hypothetical protein
MLENWDGVSVSIERMKVLMENNRESFLQHGYDSLNFVVSA